MGNCCRGCKCRVDADIDIDLESVPQAKPTALQYRYSKELRLIKNPNPHYNGYLTEQLQNGVPTGNVVVYPTYSDRSVVTVYHYYSEVPVNGTYVVLKFEESNKYFFYAKKFDDLRLRKKYRWKKKKHPRDIDSTTDPRVFLMKQNMRGGSADVVLASCVASKQEQNNSNKARVITLLPDLTKPAELMVEGGNGIEQEAQLFRLEHLVPSVDPSDEGDSQPQEHV
ncbi:uncharacterized protein LOC144906470 [Branchiostoma floridae x Branchiostoma belcheri]